jgi:hypothetical protein
MTIGLTFALTEAHAATVSIPDRAAYVDGLVGLHHPVISFDPFFAYARLGFSNRATGSLCFFGKIGKSARPAKPADLDQFFQTRSLKAAVLAGRQAGRQRQEQRAGTARTAEVRITRLGSLHPRVYGVLTNEPCEQGI